jgi:glyoxylase-like metal-dependent hydrolase (beta-lactamase superfamily II)
VTEAFICRTCGVQQTPSESPPERCPICDDERQYVGWNGQQWTTLEEMGQEGFRNAVRDDLGLTGIGTRPRFAIGQRALLVQSEHGNVLWDCTSLIDDDTVRSVEGLGGLAAIAFSHPHFYGSMVEWSRAFGGAPMYVPEADRQWVLRDDPAIRAWSDRVELAPGLTLLQTGGHFEGSAALHWAEGAGGKGALLVGDTAPVVQDRRYVSFMRSYPNYIPLPESAVRRILDTVLPFPFDRIYGGWWGDVVAEAGHRSMQLSAERYIRYLRDLP